jgi:hypothetical protein
LNLVKAAELDMMGVDTMYEVVSFSDICLMPSASKRGCLNSSLTHCCRPLARWFCANHILCSVVVDFEEVLFGGGNRGVPSLGVTSTATTGIAMPAASRL